MSILLNIRYEVYLITNRSLPLPHSSDSGATVQSEIRELNAHAWIPPSPPPLHCSESIVPASRWVRCCHTYSSDFNLSQDDWRSKAKVINYFKNLVISGVVKFINTQAHSSHLVQTFLAKHRIPVVRQPSYSPCMVPSDLYRFRNSKSMKESHFKRREDMVQNAKQSWT